MIFPAGTGIVPPTEVAAQLIHTAMDGHTALRGPRMLITTAELEIQMDSEDKRIMRARRTRTAQQH